MVKEKYIAVMGVTGAGKSSFIRLVTGDDSIKVGNTLVSETQQLSTYKFRHKDRTIVLVDTPGFDDTTKKDADVLKLLADWLESMYKAGTKLSGIIYLHRISDDRMRGSSMRSMRMFRSLCGEAFYRNLLLGTTCWSLISEDIGMQREKELMTDQNFWKGLIAKGAQFVRIPDDGWDAKELVYDLAKMEPASLQIQEEMVDKHINFDNLSAAQTLDDGAKALREAQEEEKRRLAEEHQRKVAEQSRRLQQQRLQLEQEKQTKLRMFQLDTERDIMTEDLKKFNNGLTNKTYIANLHPLSNSLGSTCDGCCRWLGNDPSYRESKVIQGATQGNVNAYAGCSTCHNGTFRLCSECYHSRKVFCHDPSHHSSMETIVASDGPPQCRHVKLRISPEAALLCYRCSKNITGVFSHCCMCSDDNFNMCLECLESGGTCKKSWSLSGHRMHAILRRQRFQSPLGQSIPVRSKSEVQDDDLRRQSSQQRQYTNGMADKNTPIQNLPTINVQGVTLSHTLTAGKPKAIETLKFSPNDNILVSGGNDGTIRLWDTNRGTLEGALTGHKGAFCIEDTAFGSDGNMLASASNDSTVRLWDMRTRSSIHTFDADSMAYGVAISPDGTKVAAGLYSNAKIWDIRSTVLLHTLIGHKSVVNSVAFSPSGKRLATTGNDKTIRVWGPQSGKLFHTINAHPGMMNYVMAVQFSPDGNTIASGGLDSSMKLWNSETGEHIRQFKSKNTKHVLDLSFSPGGKIIAAGQLSGGVEFWNAEEGFVVHNLQAHKSTVNTVAFSSNGRLFATGSEDKTVNIWRF